MVSNKIYTMTPSKSKAISKIVNYYIDTAIDTEHKIKVSWLMGMRKKTNYDEHERNMLNKMVKRYNKENVKKFG